MGEFSGVKNVSFEEIGKFGAERVSKFDGANATYCPNYAVPSIHAYLSEINVYGMALFTFGGLIVLVVVAMFIDTLSYIMKNSSSRVKTHSAFVVGVYPVVALSTYCAMLVPRSHLLAEAITQGIFMAAMYQLFCLFVGYCGGEAELIRRIKPAMLNSRVGPLCCLPCCFFLPSFEVNKNNVRRLRLLVLQLPVVQGLVYMTLLIMWAERESLYQINYLYIQPIIMTSILFGIWGMIMTITLVKNVLNDCSMPAKFMVLQMVLIFAKFQGLVTRIIVWLGLLPCKSPITPAVYGNLLYNSLMLFEMAILGYIARRLYKKVIPELDMVKSGLKQLCFISTIGAIMGNGKVSLKNGNSDIQTEDIKSKNSQITVHF